MLAHHLEQICKELELAPPESPSTDGIFKVAFDETLEVQFQENQDTSIYFYSEVAPAPQENGDKLYYMLMDANLLGIETGLSVLGINAKEDKVTLSRLLPKQIDYSDFRNELESFLNYSESWQAEVLRYSEENQTEKS